MTNIYNLPNELIWMIIKYVHIEDVCNMTETCKHLSRVITKKGCIHRIKEEVKQKKYKACR